jgi:hypothetical protein
MIGINLSVIRMHHRFLRNDHGQRTLAVVLRSRRCTLGAGTARASHSRFTENRDRAALADHFQEFHFGPTSKVILNEMRAHLQKVQKANGHGSVFALTRPRQ